VVEKSSSYFDKSFGALASSVFARGMAGGFGTGGGGEEADLDEAETHGIMLHYDTDTLPTVLDVGSEIPPGVVRFLGTTFNGGWRNPAKHTLLTGVAVLAAGKW
jgi:hypothetical protein